MSPSCPRRDPASRRRRKALGLVAGAIAVASFATAPAAVVHASPAAIAARAQPDALAGQAASALGQLQAYLSGTSSASLPAYQRERNAIAATVGERLAIDPARLTAAWAAADLTHQAALMAAFTQLGVPYRRNTSKPGTGFDCSGLTTYAWGVAGVGLTRSSATQIRAASARTASTAQAGDLVYYPGHVMIWLGVDSAIVHSPQSGQVVTVGFYAAKRARSIRFGNPIG